jgi:exopolyphosphatase/guanosine-5'-triphosphate,3'-diphosphate pyrophosphatase
VGGGSTELALYGGEQKEVCRSSFRLGTVRILAGTAEDSEYARFRRTAAEICRDHAPGNLVALGGNINKAQKLLDKKKGEALTPEELAALHDKLAKLTFEERVRTFGLQEYRADVIVPALEIFMTLFACCASLKKIYVPKIGVADGLIRQMLTDSTKGRLLI